MQSALVTGGAGFIGSNLVRALVASGEKVRVLDDMSTGSVENLASVNGSVELVEGDLRDPYTVRRAVSGIQVVYHLGAIPSVARSVADPRTSHAVNVNGALNVLMAARDEEVRRIVFASSSSVYGDTQILPKHEGMPVAPTSPYAAGKLAGEGCMQSFAATYGMETISLRFFNVFGPNQNPASEYAAVVPRFMSRMLSGAPPLIFGDGFQSRDFTFVANVVQACLLAADAGPEAIGQVVNVGCGTRTSLLDLVETMNQLLGTELRPGHLDPRPGDVRDSQADVSKAQQVIGYRPLVSLREGLRRTIDWMAERRAAVGAG